MGGLDALNHWFDSLPALYQFLTVIGGLLFARLTGHYLRSTWSEPGAFWVELSLGLLVLGYLFWFLFRLGP